MESIFSISKRCIPTVIITLAILLLLLLLLLSHNLCRMMDDPNVTRYNQQNVLYPIHRGTIRPATSHAQKNQPPTVPPSVQPPSPYAQHKKERSTIIYANQFHPRNQPNQQCCAFTTVDIVRLAHHHHHLPHHPNHRQHHDFEFPPFQSS